MKAKTWKIIELGIDPASKIFLICPHCCTDAEMPMAKIESPVIASIGLGLVFDDSCYVPKNQILPTIIKCRYCRRTYEFTNEEKFHG